MAYLYLVRPMKHLLPTMLFALTVSTTLAQSKPLGPTADHKAKALAIAAPRPAYPKDERGRRPTGHGIVVMDVDPKTGWVTSARMEKSTGSKLLDDAALAAFSRCVFDQVLFDLSTLRSRLHTADSQKA